MGMMPRSMPRRPHSNPFRFGALAIDESFADREQEIGELMADVRNGQDVVILAPRRYGKSSLAWKAAQALVAEDVLVAQVDLMTAPTKERLAEKLAESIYADVASILERARERALAPFRGLQIQPVINVNPDDGSFSFSFGVARTETDVDATLERLLALPAELGAERSRRVALIIDEFQEIVELDPRLPNLMRSVFQQQPDVAHIYLGSRRHIMERIFNDVNEPFWRSAKSIELGPIEVAPFAAFIAERFRETRKEVAPSVLDELLRRTGGQPYATQELCYSLWEQVPSDGTARGDELERALEAVLRSEHAHFTLLWEELSAVQKLVLTALASDQPGRPFTAEYRRVHNLPPPTNVQKALRALVEREIVTSDEGEYAIAEPFLTEWMRHNITRAGA